MLKSLLEETNLGVQSYNFNIKSKLPKAIQNHQKLRTKQSQKSIIAINLAGL